MERFRTDESGASAALYALALPALVAAVGIGFDYARVAGMDSELQNAADHAALAGATQLDQSDGSIGRATAAARNGLATNSTLFANDGSGTTVTIPTTGVFFYETQANAEASANPIDVGATGADARARFIRVVVDTRRANYALTPVVGAFFGDIAAEAVAGIGSALCRTPPLMICNPLEPLNNTNKNFPFNANDYEGIGLFLKGGANGGGGAWAPGNFGYLDTIPGTGGGTPDLRKALGWDIPPGECVSKTANDSVDTDTGNKTDIADSINTRFDIYNGDVSCPTGGNCPASINSQKDVIHDPLDFGGTNACKLHSNGWKELAAEVDRYLPGSNDALPVGSAPKSMGHPRDICHSTDPHACSGPLGDGFWDRDAYFASHYRKADGTYWDAATWQARTGFTKSGGTGTRYRYPTRYQIYSWEIANRNTQPNADGIAVLGQNPSDAFGGPQCSAGKGFGSGTVPSDTVADRRRLSVAVINCQAHSVNGNSRAVPVVEFMDVFLVQPSLNRDRTRKDEIYAEIIGKTAAGSAGETAGTVIRRDVPFLIK
ncbi:MAG: pilus assembly protein TadG-related protein [Erythrobacter sp.]